MGSKDYRDAAPLYDNEVEEQLHRRTIETISLVTGERPEAVQRLYEIVLRRFKKEARIGDYLPVLVGRKVAHLYRKHRARQRS